MVHAAFSLRSDRLSLGSALETPEKNLALNCENHGQRTMSLGNDLDGNDDSHKCYSRSTANGVLDSDSFLCT